MEAIKAQVHMVPVSDATLIKRGQLWTHNNGGKTHLFIWSDADNTVKSEELKGYCIPQHLYLTTDEEIKAKDWIIHTGQGLCKVYKISESSENDLVISLPDGTFPFISRRNGRKIVATTNPELWGNPRSSVDGEYKSGEGVGKIPSSFIEEYAKNPVTEVLLEVIKEHQHGCGTFYSHKTNHFNNCGPKCTFNNPILKLSSEGVVIIVPKQQKIYTREEVWTILKRAAIKGHDELKEWFDKNYPV